MSADLLLLWMSARCEGSWRQFRRAVEELRLADADDAGEPEADRDAPQKAGNGGGISLHQTMRFNLERAAHAEFFSAAGSSEWRVAPPSIGIVETDGGWLGVVAGARTDRLLDRMLAGPAGLTVEAVSVRGYPQVIRVLSGSEAELTLLARDVGLEPQISAPTSILLSLPPFGGDVGEVGADFPGGKGWKVERFSAQRLKWLPSSTDEARGWSWGLFRFCADWERPAFLVSSGSCRSVSVQGAKFAVLQRAKRRVLSYDRSWRTLSAPVACRPPLLVERALIACSGFPPDLAIDGGRLTYSDVSIDIARLAFENLRQGTP